MVVATERLRTNEILHDPRIVRLNEASFWRYRERMADLYYLGWTEQGLCPSREEAVRRLDQCLPQNTFVVFDDQRQEVFGVLNTVSAQVGSTLELCERFPTYRSVEAAASEPSTSNEANVCICYSVVVPHGLKMAQSTPAMMTKAVAEYLLKTIPLPPQQRKIAYSRFGNVPSGRSLLDHYQASQGNVVDSGAVGLHERLGGLTVALIDHSRTEDRLGGGGNVLVAYPTSAGEATRFADLRQKRQQELPPVEQHGAITLFQDLVYNDGHI